MQDAPVEGAPEPSLPRALPLPVHVPERDVLVRPTRVEPDDARVAAPAAILLDGALRRFFAGELGVVEHERVPADDLGRWVVVVVVHAVVLVPLVPRPRPRDVLGLPPLRPRRRPCRRQCDGAERLRPLIVGVRILAIAFPVCLVIIERGRRVIAGGVILCQELLGLLKTDEPYHLLQFVADLGLTGLHTHGDGLLHGFKLFKVLALGDFDHVSRNFRVQVHPVSSGRPG